MSNIQVFRIRMWSEASPTHTHMCLHEAPFALGSGFTDLHAVEPTCCCSQVHAHGVGNTESA